MRIRTEEQLTDSLNEELGWRKIELSMMRKTVQSSALRRESALLRGALALLYAHWEGYVKEAGTHYLNFVVHQGLKYRELPAHFLALSVKAKLDVTGAALKACVYRDACEVFVSGMEHRAVLTYKDVVDTGSNLSAHVFRNILCLLGLDPTPYAAKERPIIDELLKLRNKIAHGKWVAVDFDSYDELHGEILDMLDLFKLQIETAASLGHFKR